MAFTGQTGADSTHSRHRASKPAQVNGRRPAYSIKARGFASHTEAGCMAAIFSCDSGTQKSAWQKGASMYGGPPVQKPFGFCTRHAGPGMGATRASHGRTWM